MKAVILEKRNGRAAVLKEDGTIVKVRTSLSVGETMELSERSSRPLFTRHMLAAAMAVMLCVSLGFGWNFMTVQAYSYISLDVNPSVEYTLNRLDRVISVEAVNADAEEIVAVLKAENINGKKITDALQVTEQVLSEQGWLSEEDYMLVNISADNETRRQRLEEITIETLNDRRPEHLVVTTSSLEVREMAREAGFSTGRYEELQRTGMEAGEMPVNDLLRESGRVPAAEPDHAEQMPEAGPMPGNEPALPEERGGEPENRPEAGPEQPGGQPGNPPVQP